MIPQPLVAEVALAPVCSLQVCLPQPALVNVVGGYRPAVFCSGCENPSHSPGVSCHRQHCPSSSALRFEVLFPN